METPKKPEQGYDDEVTALSEKATEFKNKGGSPNMILRFMKAAYNKFFKSNKLAKRPRLRKNAQKRALRRMKGEDNHDSFSEN